MKVGVDGFTLRDLHLDPIGMLDYAKAHGLAGVHCWVTGLDGPDGAAKAGEVRDHADSLGLYIETSGHTPNPHLSPLSREQLVAQIGTIVANAAECGWHELHSWCGGPDARWQSAVSWTMQMQDTQALFKEIAPVLRDHGSRLNMEPKGGLSTFDVVEIIEAVGPDVAGVCLDTANTLCFAEDPVAAARRVAPYTHMTHAKDAIIYFYQDGLRRQVRPPGQGVLDWDEILLILAEHSPDLTLSIEDHKWLYDVPIFTNAWHDAVPQISARELARTVNLARQCQEKLAAGDLGDPDEYEKVPHISEMQKRLDAGRDYLNDCLERLDLAS